MASQVLCTKQLLKQGNMGAPRWLSCDLAVRELEPHIRLGAVSAEPALDPLSPSLSAPHLCIPSLSLSLINIKKLKKIKSDFILSHGITCIT